MFLAALAEARDAGDDPMAALEDAWLMRVFPGRTLEELDGVDVRRLRAAQDARRVVDVELRRQAFLRGDIDDLAVDEWEMVRDVDLALGESLDHEGAK